MNIQEDYVSFETAKLLKNKEFNIPLLTFYITDEERKESDFQIMAFTDDKIDNNYSDHCYLAPTLQMAMKWLRENKKILISIFCHIDKGYWFCIQHFVDSPYKFATSESIHRKEEILGKIQYYDTYEQACEAAIKYCLENLI